MMKVNLPAASWDEAILALDMLIEQGYLFRPLREEIAEQVYSQES